MLVKAEDAAINSHQQQAFAFPVFLLLVPLLSMTFARALLKSADQAVSMDDTQQLHQLHLRDVSFGVLNQMTRVGSACDMASA